MTRPICIYHGPGCMDGLAAAWAVWKRFAGAVDLVPAQYGETPPDVVGREVYIVDFSYKRDVLKEMADVAKSITVIDHHVSAQADLAGGFPANVDAVFDMAKSGAVLAWEYFHSAPCPELLLHIQDRDLWKFELKGTREIHAALVAVGPGVGDVDKLVRLGGVALEEAEADGSAILLAHNQAIADALKSGTHRMYIAGFGVFAANLPYAWASDACHKLLADHPHIPFAATYVRQPNMDLRGATWKFSLRSEDDRMDVSEVARQYGGGGHRNAAGFTIRNLEDLKL